MLASCILMCSSPAQVILQLAPQIWLLSACLPAFASTCVHGVWFVRRSPVLVLHLNMSFRFVVSTAFANVFTATGARGVGVPFSVKHLGSNCSSKPFWFIALSCHCCYHYYEFYHKHAISWMQYSKLRELCEEMLGPPCTRDSSDNLQKAEPIGAVHSALGSCISWDRHVLGLDKRELLRNVVLPAISSNRCASIAFCSRPKIFSHQCGCVRSKVDATICHGI
eukprot:SAG31_NODE_12702_length_923_cov_1.046117_1_plen_223_part_00